MIRLIQACRPTATGGGLLALAIVLLFVPAGSEAFYVHGHVRDGGAQGIPDIDLDVHDATTGASVNLHDDNTDATGYYEIFLPPGTYDIAFSAAAGVARVGVELEDVVVSDQLQLDVVMQNGSFIFGTVRNPGLAPVAAVDIDVLDRLTQSKLYTPHDDTDANGFYAVVVPAGTYDLVFEPPVATGLAAARDDSVFVLGDVERNRVLPSGFVVSGTVLDPNDDPLTGVNLDVWNSVTGMELPLTGDRTDALGQYQIILPPGTYDIEFAAPGALGYDPFLATSVLVLGPTQVNAQLGFPVMVTGLARGANLLPAAGVKIKVYDVATGDRVPLDGDVTDFDGTYTIFVPTGLLDFMFLSPEGNGWASLPQRNVLVTGDMTLNPILPTGFTLTGTITDPLGLGVPGVDLDLEEPVTGIDVPLFNDNTDALGNFTLVAPAGTYNLDIDAGAGVRLVAEYHPGLTLPGTTLFDRQLTAGVFVSGRVIDHGSNPWPGIDIDVHLPGLPIEIETRRDDTDGDGNYQVVVPTGVYNFVYVPPPGIPVEADSIESVVVTTDLVLDMILDSTLIGVTEAAGPASPATALLPNRPNPFNPSTDIEYRLAEAGAVRLEIFDVGGRFIRSLVDGPQGAGRHTARWDGRNGAGRPAASGVYFLRLDTPNTSRVRKLVLSR